MAKTTSIHLNDRWESFIAELIAKGRFDSASEAIRGALRLLEIEEEKFDRLCEALDEGLASGPAEPFDMKEIIGEAHRLHKRAA